MNLKRDINDVKPGDAQRLTEEIAEQLYLTTQGLAGEMPIEDSKILGLGFISNNGNLINKGGSKVKVKGEQQHQTREDWKRMKASK